MSNTKKIKEWKEIVWQKKILIPVVALVLLAVFIFWRNESKENFTTVLPNYGELRQTVQATGQVTSKTELSLSFEKQGTVKSVKVAVGDKVKTGQVLASLNSDTEYAKLLEAKASLVIAEAKLKKILEGASNEEVNLAKVSLTNAKTDLTNITNTQNTLVKNAYRKLLNSTLEARSVDASVSVQAPAISGTYRLDKEGSINVKVYTTGGGLAYSYTGLVSGVDYVDTTGSKAVGESGLYIAFSSSSSLSGTSWVIEIPNKKSSDYLANLNAYESALKTQDAAIASATSLVDSKQAELDLKLAKARDADVALGEAEVVSAKSGVTKAELDYNNTILRAPADGTITKVDVKYGELSSIGKPVVLLEDVSNLYVEADINESNIVSVVENQPVDIKLDAISDKKFSGVISHIDPSSVTDGGVVNYKVKVSINETDANIRPGMNAEITILINSKQNAISIPKALITEKNGKYFATVVFGDNKTKEVEVVTGITGDGNLVEIVSGLSASDKVVQVTK